MFLKKIVYPFYNNDKLSDEKGRLYFFDNAKFILIFFVVLAHAISPFKQSGNPAFVAWAVINYFHMPTLIFISGFFAKRYISKLRVIKAQRLFTYVVLYVASQIAVTLFEILVLKSTVSWNLFSARSSLWFLQCLILWYLILPSVDYFKPKFIMIFAVVFALFVGYQSNVANFMALSRAFVHFPFFIAGYYCTQENIDKLVNSKKFKLVGLLIFGAVIAVSAILPQTAISQIITCNTPYKDIAALAELPIGLRFTSRLYFYVVAVGLGISFLSFVPRGKTVYTSLGSKTLSVYILHRFLYLAYLEYRWYDIFNTPLKQISVIFISLALTVILSLKPMTIPLDALQKIKASKLMKKID